MKLSDLQKHITETLKSAGIESADQEARIMLEVRLGLSWADLIAHTEKEIESESILGDLQKRIAGMPLGRIYGRGHFYGMDFRLSPETLDPRADTEVLVDLALKESAPQRVLDLGTGTGCILLAILKNCSDASGIGIDQSQGALDIAQMNALDHGLENRTRFMRGDWAAGVNEAFDLVVSNPPYIESGVIPGLQNEVKNYDPILALDGGADGMEAYKIIFSQLRTILKPGGTALFEIGYDQSRKIERLAGEHGFNEISIHPDYAGNPRVAKISA